MNTRRLLFFLFGICFAQASFTQSTQPERVYSIVKVYKTYEWYTQQHELWEKEIKKKQKESGCLGKYIRGGSNGENHVSFR